MQVSAKHRHSSCDRPAPTFHRRAGPCFSTPERSGFYGCPLGDHRDLGRTQPGVSTHRETRHVRASLWVEVRGGWRKDRFRKGLGCPEFVRQSQSHETVTLQILSRRHTVFSTPLRSIKTLPPRGFQVLVRCDKGHQVTWPQWPHFWRPTGVSDSHSLNLGCGCSQKDSRRTHQPSPDGFHCPQL